MALDLPRSKFVVEIVAAEQVGKAWDRFVEVHPRATIGHLRAWGRVIHDAYGHESIALAAVEDGEVVGILPLVLVRSRLFGDRLVSMPFLDYGGILVDPEDARAGTACHALFDASLEAARVRGARSLGLRQFHPIELATSVTDDRVTMLLPLSTADAVWKSLPSERRNRVRKGEKSGLAAVWGGAELLDDFYGVFAANMRDLGSPVHHAGFFRAMLEGLGGDTARVLLVREGNGRPVGAAVCLFFRDTIAVPWVSSRREAWALCPNFVLYWEVIRFGCEQGYRTLDLGRSFKNAGTFEFKRQWGAHPHPLPWIFRDLVPGAPPSVDRDSSRFHRLADLWKRLPVPVANVVGPWVRRQLPN